MRVLMFGWEFPPYAAGGLATATLSLAHGLTRMGVEVTLIVPFPADARDAGSVRVVSATDVAPGLRMVRVASPLTPYASFGPVAPWARRAGGPTAYRESLLEDVDEFADAGRILAARHEHDVIHSHDWMAYGAGVAARALSGKPLVAHIHATEHDRSGDWSNAEILHRERAGLRAADRVIANSYVTKRQVVERYGVHADVVDVVHWGIEPRPQDHARGIGPFGSDVPIVLFLGRLAMQKGPDYFIKAAARVAELNDEVRFVVAGSGDMMERLLLECVRLGISDRVHFTGGISREEAERLYRIATVCVMPSVSEPFGLVALESLRAETPVIVSKRAGVSEAVANLLTVEFWDIDDMADKILAVVSDPVLLGELRRRTQEELADLRRGADEPARLTVEAYRSAIARNR
jgi:glycogen(starch) synthase